MKGVNFVLSFICIGLLSLIGLLSKRLIHAINEELYFNKKSKILNVQENKLIEEFKLKQDYMRKMICDKNFIEQIIHEKTGLCKPNEIIVKFED